MNLRVMNRVKLKSNNPAQERRSGLLNAFPVRWSIIRSGHHISLLDGLYKSILHGCSGAPDPNTGRLSLLCSLLIELSLVEIRSDPCVRLSEPGCTAQRSILSGSAF